MSKRWYVVHAYSGMEKSVGRAIRERVERSGMQDMFLKNPLLGPEYFNQPGKPGFQPLA